jgi:hypothetical protein
VRTHAVCHGSFVLYFHFNTAGGMQAIVSLRLRPPNPEAGRRSQKATLLGDPARLAQITIRALRHYQEDACAPRHDAHTASVPIGKSCTHSEPYFRNGIGCSGCGGVSRQRRPVLDPTADRGLCDEAPPRGRGPTPCEKWRVPIWKDHIAWKDEIGASRTN